MECGSSAVPERSERTVQGLPPVFAVAPWASSSTSAALAAHVVLRRLRYKLSPRDLTEMFLIRDIVFSYEAVRDWEAKLGAYWR